MQRFKTTSRAFRYVHPAAPAMFFGPAIAYVNGRHVFPPTTPPEVFVKARRTVARNAA